MNGMGSNIKWLKYSRKKNFLQCHHPKQKPEKAYAGSGYFFRIKSIDFLN